MKCLLCSASFNNDKRFIEHYIEYHNINQANKFFQKPFQQNSSIFYKCFQYSDFLSTESFRFKHNFLKYFNNGQNIPFEDKPLEIIRTGYITSYEISVNKNRDYYYFEDVKQVIADLLRNVHSRFKTKRQILLKCWFLIENIQQPVQKSLRPIVNTRYWTIEPFETAYFNDYTFYSLKENLLKRVIVNGMSGS